MEYIAKPFQKDLRQKAMANIKQFRQTVRDMDTPAKERQLAQFKQQYEQVRLLFETYLSIFAQASVGDVPSEL